MKESNILADNVENNFLRREIWMNTNGQYMKESLRTVHEGVLADNVENNFLVRNM